MPWPGTPKSQQTPPINQPSMRFPNSLNEKSTMGDVAEAMRIAMNGLTVHEQAFANLPTQIASQASAAATAAIEQITSETTTGVTSFNSATGAIIYFPSLGMVNDQLGNPVYLTQTSDAGKKIIAGDSTPVTITLNSSVALPWFTIIGNDSTATVSITTDSTHNIVGINSLNYGGLTFIFFDGTTFWSEGYAPDGTTIVVDSTTGVSRTGGISATIITAKLTGGGSNGSMVFENGVLISQTQAT